MNSEIANDKKCGRAHDTGRVVVWDEFHRFEGDLARFKSVLNRILISQAQKQKPIVRITDGKIRRSQEPVPGVLILGDGWPRQTLDAFTCEVVGAKAEEFAVTGSVEFDYDVSSPDGTYTYRGTVELNGRDVTAGCDFTFVGREV